MDGVDPGHADQIHPAHLNAPALMGRTSPADHLSGWWRLLLPITIAVTLAGRAGEVNPVGRLSNARPVLMRRNQGGRRDAIPMRPGGRAARTCRPGQQGADQEEFDVDLHVGLRSGGGSDSRPPLYYTLIPAAPLMVADSLTGWSVSTHQEVPPHRAPAPPLPGVEVRTCAPPTPRGQRSGVAQ